MAKVESPGVGRAIITEGANHLHIVVPVKRNPMSLIGAASFLVVLWVMEVKNLISFTPEHGLQIDFSEWPPLAFLHSAC